MKLLIKIQNKSHRIIVESIESINDLKELINETFKIQKEEITLQIYDPDFQEFCELDTITEVQDKTIINVLVNVKSQDETQTR